MKLLILLALVAASGATYGSKRQQWATGNSLNWSGGDALWVSPSLLSAYSITHQRSVLFMEIYGTFMAIRVRE